MGAVVTYDVNGKHSEVKARMKARGYRDARVMGSTTYYLPNTTLWHPTADVRKALADVQAIAQELHIVLERAVSLSDEPWDAIPGKPHAT